jgi:integrase
MIGSLESESSSQAFTLFVQVKSCGVSHALRLSAVLSVTSLRSGRQLSLTEDVELPNMAVYRPKYKDLKTGKVKVSRVWWYDFTFAGRRVQESSKSTRKTIAVEAEKNRRLELEKGFNSIEDTRRERIRTVAEIAVDYLVDYKWRNPRSATFAEYAVRHIERLAGSLMSIDISDKVLKEYQTARLKERASPKSINEEVGFFLRILGEQGDLIRAKMRRLKTLKLKAGRQVAKAFSPEEKAGMLAEAKKLRSPSIYPALTLALNCGLRDAELRGLQWSRFNLETGVLTVRNSKTEAGEGRTIPLKFRSRLSVGRALEMVSR